MKTNLLSEIIDPLLPPEPHLDPDQRDEVRRNVVQFVAQQIESMPSYLRFPYRVLLRAFNGLALRQYGRPYILLDEVKQKDYVSVWIHSSIGWKCDFIKLIRSCALFRFYDHPLVVVKMEED